MKKGLYTELEEKLLEYFNSCKNLRGVTTAFLSRKYNVSTNLCRRVLHVMVKKDLVHLIEYKKKFYYCLKSWGTVDECLLNIEKENIAVEPFSNPAFDPSIIKPKQ